MTDCEELGRLADERAELVAKNEAATSWGAAVGARHEHIKEIDGRIVALRRLAEAGTQGAVAYIEREVLAVLRRDKTASGTVASGLLTKPFGDKVALYTSRPAPAVAVKVKALEWRQRASDRYEADIYSISDTFGQGPRRYFLARGSAILGYFNEIDSAKSHAQSDYEARITSALVTAPQDDVRELLTEGRQFIADSGCDEDDNEVNEHRDDLLTRIDAALAVNQSDGGKRTAPETCPNCFNESDCANVDICNAVEEVYRPSDTTSSSRPDDRSDSYVRHGLREEDLP